MSISRRKFLETSALASASLMVPQFLKGFEQKKIINKNNKILIVVQLSGGNDGLNTIIPYRNDLYYKNRQDIGINKDKVISLNDEIGLNPSLKGLKQLYDSGNLSIINGVGYPHPNRSHFRSMDIWHSGSAENEFINTGWIGRYLDIADVDLNVHNTLALETDDTLSLALKGEFKKAIAVKDINQFHNAASTSFFRKLASHSNEHQEKLAGYLYKTLGEIKSAADYIYDQSKIYTTLQTYPNTQLGKQCKTVGSLIMANTETKIYYVSHGGYDTHNAQNARQDKLLQDLDESLSALVSDLKHNNRFEDVLIMTFSEFGRRVSQNASKGTDHGTASNLFFISGSLKKPGIYNSIPNLNDLDEGDLKYEIDFKQAYATILDKWLQTSSTEILNKKFTHLDFI